MTPTMLQEPEALVQVSAPKRIHLGYLDGIRGLAALYVAINHIFWSINLREGEPLTSQLGAWVLLFGFGRISVAVFIVLSGYCLTIPIARSASHSLRDGAGGYLKRRARRILPPYYAALLLSLLLIALIPGLRRYGPDQEWNLALPIGKGNFAAHLLLIHNLRPDWIYRINPPLWSVATEWQIYFLLPFLLLPVWKRFGLPAVFLSGVAAGIAPCLLTHNFVLLASPWFVGLFAFGMAAAIIGFSEEPRSIALRRSVPWLALAGLLALPLSVFLFLSGRRYMENALSFETCAGLAFGALLIACTQTLATQPNFIVRFFQWRWFEKLGFFSYSLYLIHQPTLSLIGLVLRHLRMGAKMEFLTMLAFGMPACLLLAYGFYVLFERPFVSRADRRTA